MHRLYRNHTSSNGIIFAKDLSKLGRDLSKLIFVDNLEENFKLQPNNGLPIKTWIDDIEDNELNNLGFFLKELRHKEPKDVRPIIKSVKEELTKKMKYNVIYPYLELQFCKFLN